MPAGDNLSIRGFSARTDIFIDGVRDFGGYSRDPFNIEQVEVAKGPASAYRAAAARPAARSTWRPRRRDRRPLRDGSARASAPTTTSAARVDLNQPLDGAVEGAAFRLNAMCTDADTPGRDAVDEPALGRRARRSPSASGTPTRADRRLLAPRPGQPARLRHPLGAADTNVAARRVPDQAPPVDFEQLLRPDRPRLRGDAHRPGDRARRARLRRGAARCAASCATAAPTRDSVDHLAALREQRPAPTINRADSSRATGRRDLRSARPTSPRASAPARSSHALVAGVEVARETSENYAAHRPAAPLDRPVRPGSARPYTGPDHAHRRRHRRTRPTPRPSTPSTPLKLGRTLELTGGLRWDRFDVDYDQTRGHGALTTLERDRRHAELARGRRLQAAAQRQHLRGLRHLVQPVAPKG